MTAAQAILIHGDPRLRRAARPVAPDEGLGDLPARMLASMADHDGIGLAAPQLGDLRRVIVVSDPEVRPLRPVVMTNPEVTDTFGPDVMVEEGCLSFPGIYFNLVRPRGAEVRYRDLAGNEQTLRADGMLARVIQHEVDHLDGVLFIDRLPRWRRWLLAGALRGLRRRAGRSQA